MKRYNIRSYMIYIRMQYNKGKIDLGQYGTLLRLVSDELEYQNLALPFNRSIGKGSMAIGDLIW